MKTPVHVFGWMASLVSMLALSLTSPSAQGAEQGTFVVSDATFKTPKTWKKEQPRSSMRKAQFKVERQGIAEHGEVIFYYFGPGGAGGTDANVKRWFGQFRESQDRLGAKTEKIEVGATAVTLVRATGTFMSGSPVGPKTPKSNYSLLGAIIEAPKGHIFIKFTGPRDLVDDAAKEFREMVKSAKIGG